jgi:hypothetical protein
MLELQHEAMATLPSQASLMVLLARHVAAVLVQMGLVALAAARSQEQRGTHDLDIHRDQKRFRSCLLNSANLGMSWSALI